VLYIDDNIAAIKLNSTKDKFSSTLSLESQAIVHNTDKKGLAIQYNDDDLIKILQVAEADVKENIDNDNEIYVKARESLKEWIQDLEGKFGVLEVDFVEE
jgi:hypothetical protein